jgi:hypothetical protein
MLTAKLGIVPLKFCFKLLFTAQQLVSKEQLLLYKKANCYHLPLYLFPVAFRHVGNGCHYCGAFFTATSFPWLKVYMTFSTKPCLVPSLGCWAKLVGD